MSPQLCAFNSRLDTVDDRDVKPEDRSIKKNIMTYTQKKKKERYLMISVFRYENRERKKRPKFFGYNLPITL